MADDTQKDTIEDLLEWCKETFEARIAIKMGMKRVDGRKLPQAYASGVVPTYNQFSSCACCGSGAPRDSSRWPSMSRWAAAAPGITHTVRNNQQ